MLALAATTIAGAGQAACVGRYVVVRASGRVLRRATDVIVLGTDTAVVDPACGAAPVHPRGRRVLATWRRCAGRARVSLRARVTTDCTLVRGTVTASGAGRSTFVATLSTCGDGIVDPGRGERCDDGNTNDADGCARDCGVCTGPATFASTWDAIETDVFERHACTRCHGSIPTAHLDLRAPGGYDAIVDVPVPDAPGLFEVRRGYRRLSLLWLKVAKGTFETGFDDVPGPGMPIGGSLSPDEVEALGRWIDAGAPRDGFVSGTDALGAGCAR